VAYISAARLSTTSKLSGSDHIALAVRDPRTSLRFYREIVGIDGPVREENHGFVITTGEVSFTLFRGDPPPSLGDFHIGTSLPDAETVRRTRAELLARGVVELQWADEPGYVSMKIADPDGYSVELSWEEK
jgi:catechol 2,3-dioxygenase-like lactoylglutathione lyase family enzyme